MKQSLQTNNKVRQVQKVVPVVHKSLFSPANLIVFSIIVLILCTFLISIYAAVIVVFGLLPGLIAAFVDHEKERFLTKIVNTMNLIGITPYLANIVRNSKIESYGMSLILDPQNWLIMYSSAGFGWIIYFAAPQLMMWFYKAKVQTRMSKLHNELNDLSAEWGEGIKRGINIT